MSDPKDLYREATTKEWPLKVELTIDRHTVYHKERDLKYGTNPGQAAAVFNPHGNTPLFIEVKTGKGGPSQTNYEDIDRALRIHRSLDTMTDNPAVVIMKHVNPSGVGKNSDLFCAFKDAWDCDARAAYGGTVAFNKPVTEKFLREVYRHIRARDAATFIDVMVAPKVSPDALEFMQKKEAIRIFTYEPSRLAAIDPFSTGAPEIKRLMDGRIIVSDPYTEQVKGPLMAPDKFVCVTNMKPTQGQINPLLFAWYVCANTRSNAVVLAKETENGAGLKTVAIGTGKQERIASIDEAIAKAQVKAICVGEDPANILQGAVLASDGFIPNIDNLLPLHEKGVRAIISPGGSKFDDAIINACNEYGIAMVFTKARCFTH